MVLGHEITHGFDNRGMSTSRGVWVGRLMLGRVGWLTLGGLVTRVCLFPVRSKIQQGWELRQMVEQFFYRSF